MIMNESQHIEKEDRSPISNNIPVIFFSAVRTVFRDVVLTTQELNDFTCRL